jgi:hypothetical protein
VKERPKDLRRELSAAFIKALLASFEKHGAAAIARTMQPRITQPKEGGGLLRRDG